MNKKIMQCLLIGSLCGLLTACGHLSGNTAQIQQPLSSAPNLYPKPAEDYWQLAEASPAPERYTYLLQTAGRLLKDGHTQQAATLLKQIPSNELSAEQLNRKYLIDAEYALTTHNPQRAIRQLRRLPQPSRLTTDERILYHLNLARAYSSNGRYFASAQQHRLLEPLLASSELKMTNLRELWQNLNELDISTLNQLRLTTTKDQELAGWIQLAYITQRRNNNPQALATDLQTWRQTHPQHPAQALFKAEFDPENNITANKIALLVPLSGPLTGPGNAVRDGFMASYFQAKRAAGSTPELIILDTYQQDMADLYAKARAQGADVVVGPLSKNNVNALIQQADIDVPTLTLNQLSNKTASDVWQFGLSPQAEATAIARRAWANGHRKALVIAPQNDWGKGISNAFRSQWRLLGGKVVEQLAYTPQTNMANAIQQLLAIKQSTARYKDVKRVIGAKKLKFIPRRRQDADMIFVAAYPTQAQQIIPLLKFYYAGNLSLYGLSLSYPATSNTRLNHDLDGLIFPDMPWVFARGDQQQKRWQNSHTPWPDSFNRYNRLYALGRDAYALSTRVNIIANFPAYIWHGATGNISVDNAQYIQRQLSWARMTKGVAKELPRQA